MVILLLVVMEMAQLKFGNKRSKPFRASFPKLREKITLLKVVSPLGLHSPELVTKPKTNNKKLNLLVLGLGD
ncbi:MAG: hypothetical protein RLZZ115_2851 [Cyanobacteriota bacterium]|jgi:hypothetical protein